jgi:Fe-S cluster assembly protein SufB
MSIKEDYKYGFVTPIASDVFPKGLSEDVIRSISAKKGEPAFMLEFRLSAYRQWRQMKEPAWAHIDYPPIDYQAISYFSEPRSKPRLDSLDEVEPELLKTLDRLGISIDEQKRLANVAIDVVFDSVSLGITFQQNLKEMGIILCSISEAVREYPELIRKYLGTIVPPCDNFFAALNSAVFSDGSFIYIPKGVRCPMELSTYFRINEREIGQFERTLIIAEEGSYVSYLEGCTAPAFDTNQLHGAVVELVAHQGAEIKYSTVQNWYAGDPETGRGGVFNFVTKRGLCAGDYAKISWTQVEAGAAVTWKYPSCILRGDHSIGAFYSVALTNGHMQADTGSRMIHLGRHTRSTIVSKGISADESVNSYRGRVMIDSGAAYARNHSQCDSMLVGSLSSANTFPSIDGGNATAQVEHEASVSRLNEEQIFYLQSRGLTKEDAIGLIVNGFCKEVIAELPLEFAQEAQKLLALKLENSVG